MTNHQPDILAIFTECLARPSDDDRSAYLDQACQGTPKQGSESRLFCVLT